MADDLLIGQDDFPWRKVESLSQRVLDNDDTFPTMDIWFVTFTDPKRIKPLQEYHRSRPALAEAIHHLKLIRKKESESGEVLFQVIVGASNAAPNDLPEGYSIPEKCSVPSTPSLTRVQLQEKNKLWPTAFSPHLFPSEHKLSQEELDFMVSGMKMAVEEARLAASLGEVTIAGCILPDAHLDAPLLAHDTRVSARHPLRHTVMNLVRALGDKVLKDPNQIQASTSRPLSSTPAERSSTPTLQNGEGYLLTNRTLFITHEPCLMCTMALVHSRVKEVIYLYPMSETGGCGGRTIVPDLPTINHRFDIWCWKEDRLAEFFDEEDAIENISIETFIDA
ncbi:hypothetical protein FRC19_004896 [Serendipita sp. 401]|nr:hypothetical protein FRC19_004896 [Serendipita sp. 401]